MSKIKEILDAQYAAYNADFDASAPDPLLVARQQQSEYAALVCALFAYGNARLIVKFLQSVDFSFLTKDPAQIKRMFAGHYYRFQTPLDVQEFFCALRRLQDTHSLKDVFKAAYDKEHSVLDGIFALIELLRARLPRTQGLDFLVGRAGTNSPYKRWNMFLRWMVRKDRVDLGLWSGISTAHLIIPLDTHTFKVSQKIGLLARKTYDLKSALLLTEKLREFEPLDPVKYDFALYRIGQFKQLDTLFKTS